MAGGEFTEKARALIRQRAQGRCEVCGLMGAVQIHHRQPRGMGGARNHDVRSPSNGLLVHGSCHNRIEMHRTKSYLLGHLVHRWSNPEETHVRLWDGWFYLTPDGGRTPASALPETPDG